MATVFFFKGILPENRQVIYNEIQQYKRKIDELFKNFDEISKQIESNLLEKNTLDENLNQLMKYIDEKCNEIENKSIIVETLKDKKNLLNNTLKNIEQDIHLHKKIIEQLETKVRQISDANISNKFNICTTNYDNLRHILDKKMTDLKQYIENHQKYHDHFDLLQKLIENCTNRVNKLFEESLIDNNDDIVIENIEQIHHIINDKNPECRKLLKDCDCLLKTVINETADNGTLILNADFNQLQQKWQNYENLCTNNLNELEKVYKMFKELEILIKSLEDWLRNKEIQIKDQSLKNSEQTKRNHLRKLETYQNEILAKNRDFNSVQQQFHQLRKETDFAKKLSFLITKYQNITKLVQEMILKYQHFVSDHEIFNRDFTNFDHMLTNRIEYFQTHLQLSSDSDHMSKLNSDLQILLDQHLSNKSQLDQLFDLGEFLLQF